MTLKHVLIGFACAVAFPVAASAQSPVPKMAPMGDCCATEPGAALAASVLLPAAPASPAAPCCEAAPAAAAVDHATHLPQAMAAPASHAGHQTAGMACCAHEEGLKPASMAQKDTKAPPAMAGGCDMPCCAGTPPKP